MKNIVKFTGRFFAAFAAIVFIYGCKAEVSDSEKDYKGETGSISVSFAEGAEARDSRALMISELKSAKAVVTGFDSKGEKFTKTSGVVALTGGKADSISVTDIPVCKNAAVVVTAFSDTTGSSEVKGGVISAYVEKIEGGKNNSVSVTWNESKKGNVYAALIEAGLNTNTLTDAQISSIDNAIPTDIHASLINAAAIAAAAKEFVEGTGTLGEASEYKLTAGSVKVTCNEYDGMTLQITDPLSSVATASTSGAVTISNVAPGIWTLYVLEGDTVKDKKTVTITSGGSINVEIGQSVITDKIIVHAKNYPAIYIFDTTGISTNSYNMTPEGNDWYTYTLNVTSAKLIFKTSKDSWTNQTADLTRTAGEWWFVGDPSSSSKPSGTWYSSNPDVPPEPEAPTLTISPAGNTIATNGKIRVVLTDGNDTISSAAVTVTGVKNKSYTYSDFTNNVLEIPVSELTSEADKSISVSASVTNSIGSANDSKSYTTFVNEVSIISNFNELVMFQVMVSHFQDGDSSIGYTSAYGPSGQTYGGDLRGIINSLDYLQDLGVNALWMTPIFNSNSSSSGDQMASTGYYTYDYFDIDPRFGSKAVFKELVDECHERGINVILDGVVGHWGSNVAESPTGKTPSRSHGQYKGCNYPESLEFFEEVLSYWIENYDIDGWRLDQAYQAGARTDDVYTGNTNYWPQLRAAVEAAAATNGTKGQNWGTLGYMCGEVLDGNQSNIQKWVVVNDGLQSNFDFPSRYKLCNAIVGGSDWADSAGSDTFVSAMTYTYNTYSAKGYTHSKGYYPNLFLSNHDLLRFGDLIIDWKKYSYGSDNYVGKYKVALASLASYTGPITLYMGDEWGEATQDIKLITSLSTPVGKGSYWDNSSRTSGHIDKAINGSSAEKEVLSFTKKLLAARKAHKALWNGGSTVQTTSSSDFFVTKKVCDGETIYVCINNSTSSKTFSGVSGDDLLSDYKASGSVEVPALSARYILVK